MTVADRAQARIRHTRAGHLRDRRPRTLAGHHPALRQRTAERTMVVGSVDWILWTTQSYRYNNIRCTSGYILLAALHI